MDKVLHQILNKPKAKWHKLVSLADAYLPFKNKLEELSPNKPLDRDLTNCAEFEAYDKALSTRESGLAKHQSLTALNRILNAPASIIPSPYNGIRGKLFEEWCVANLGLVAPGPTFIDDRFSTEDRRRQADGVRVQGNMLIDAKVRQGGRPNTTDKSQMVDYNIIITNRLKSIETAGTANQPIYRGPFLTQCNTSSIIQNNLNFGTMIYKTDSVKTSLQCLSMTRQRNLTKRSDI